MKSKWHPKEVEWCLRPRFARNHVQLLQRGALEHSSDPAAIVCKSLSLESPVMKFVESLEEVGVQPVFFVGTPPSSRRELEQNFEKYKEATLQVQEVYAHME